MSESEKVGICIISFNSPEDAKDCVASIVAHTPKDNPILLWDNSTQFVTGSWAVNQAATFDYIRSPYNVGTCISRNAASSWMLRHGLLKWVFMDQDVRVTADGWLDDMLAVFQKYPDTGCVAFKFIADQLQAHYDMDESGATPQVPGACCMWSAECVRAIGGWYPGALYYRIEDSDACLRAGIKGFKTRLVLGEQKISHDHPSSGMARNPRDAAIRAVSEAIFQQRARALNFPKIPGVTA